MFRMVKYLLCALAGLTILFLYSLVHPTPPAVSGEYYYSEFLRNNYTVVSAMCFFIVGISLGYACRLRPFAAGLCMVAAFPVTALVESLVYRGSHNLIPFEFAIHFLFALPGILGLYLGRAIRARKQQALK